MTSVLMKVPKFLFSLVWFSLFNVSDLLQPHSMEQYYSRP